MDVLVISYRFELPAGQVQVYDLKFDRQTMKMINENPSQVDWVRLDSKKCSHCPLNSKDSPYCPIAQNLHGVAAHFANDKSVVETKIQVTTGDRTYSKIASLQEGLQGIFGLIMATSGCPHMEFLKPMARFHMPFSSDIETMVRTTSLYLLRQYFNLKDGKPADFLLKGLEANYANVALVNQGIVERIRGMSVGDADRNALVLLDCFSSMISMEMSGDMGDVRQAME
ncbi:MAG: hypothetical protein JNM39_14045 [Bdellovibrionaceae bacterium]|nr:hypothetical protein [Pseudobdellovibrionaceae bacterium]